VLIIYFFKWILLNPCVLYVSFNLLQKKRQKLKYLPNGNRFF